VDAVDVQVLDVVPVRGCTGCERVQASKALLANGKGWLLQGA